MTNTTITLAGAMVPQPMSLTRYRGELFQPPNVVVPLIYVNKVTRENFDAAVEDLFNLITERVALGPVTVVGHSMGGQVIAGLLRKLKALGLTPWPVDQVTFIVCGFPESEFGGFLRIPNSGGKFIYDTYGGPGIPDDTDYPVLDVKRQYDFFADHPDVLTNKTAQRNVSILSPIHSDYDDVGILDPTNLAYRKPGTKITIILVPTFPMPIVNIFTWADGIYRAAVEAGYRRPPYRKLSELGAPEDPTPARIIGIRTTCPGTGKPSKTRPVSDGKKGVTGTCPSCDRTVPLDAKLFSYKVRRHYLTGE